jgi:hypothetical protein
MRRLVLLTGCVVLSLQGCSSNNTGKIVGKWELTGGRPPGASEIWEFTADGKVSVKMSIGARNKSLKGTYTLGSGDTVCRTNQSHRASSHFSDFAKSPKRDQLAQPIASQ